MSWLVKHLRETETPLASLYAFREPFYRKFGYEVAGRRLKIVCPSTRWPKLESSLPVKRLAPADWAQLVVCYTAFAEARSGLNLRTQRQWQRVLGENRELTIYAVGEPVEAYAVVSHKTEFWTTDHISEIVWSTRLGYEALLSMLGGLAINKTALSWFEPSDGPFYSDYLDQGISVSLERPVMFRANDVAASLRALKPDPHRSGEFSIWIADKWVPENQGPWHVRFRDGSVEVEEASERPRTDLRINVRHFAQALLGEPSLEQLATSGSVEVGSNSGLTAACKLLTPHATYCLDFF